MKNNIYILTILALILLVCYNCIGDINNYFGWDLREQWKYRRTTSGDINESKKRGVFVKDLIYTSNVSELNFDIFIEHGFSYSKDGMSATETNLNSNFPYQVSFPKGILIDSQNCEFQIANKERFDSISDIPFNKQIYLRKPILPDTLKLDVVCRNSDLNGMKPEILRILIYEE